MKANLVFVLPFFLLKRLRMIPRPQLLGLISVFGLGGIAIVMSIARIIALAISATTTAVAVWTALECSTGIMVACCPALRSLFRRPGDSLVQHSTGGSLRSPARIRERANSAMANRSANKNEQDMDRYGLVEVTAGPNMILKNVDFEIESERASQLSRPLEKRIVNKRHEAWDEP